MVYVYGVLCRKMCMASDVMGFVESLMGLRCICLVYVQHLVNSRLIGNHLHLFYSYVKQRQTIADKT